MEPELTTKVPAARALFIFVDVQRGFTLVELAIVAGIVALLAFGTAFTLGNKPYAVRSSAILLNASLAQARALAESSGNGATLVAVQRGDRALLYLYRGRPNDPQTMTEAAPPVEMQAALSEARLGSENFAIFVDGGGHATGLGGYPPLQNGAPATFPALAASPPCPEGGFVLTVSSGKASEPVPLACNVQIFGPPDAVPSP